MSRLLFVYLEDSPGDDAPALPRLAALHGVGLTRPRLAIAEQTHLHPAGCHVDGQQKSTIQYSSNLPQKQHLHPGRPGRPRSKPSQQMLMARYESLQASHSWT